MKYQSTIIIEELDKNKKISRNWCLKRGITRLGSHIGALIADGWKFDDTPSDVEIMRGKYIKGDYWYFVVSRPKIGRVKLNK